MTIGSLFSGVGGFEMGLEAAGMRVAWQVEVDPQARAVLRKHWPNVDLHEDVREVGRHNLEPVDLICGGFPCQDLSMAGRRAGLAGERSGLFYEFMRIVDELAPRWVLIENVPGLLSSNGGRDMGAVLGALAELGYGWTYRVLDLQHFGVPQRRRRVFIVGHLGGFCPPEILLEPESLPGDSPAREETRQGAAGFATAGTLDARQTAGGFSGTDGAASGHVIAGTVAAKWAKGTGGPAGDEVQNIVAHTLRAEGFDASEDGTGRGTPLVTTSQSPTGHQGDRFIDPRDVAFTLLARGGNNGGGGSQIVAPHPAAFNAKQATEDAAEDVPPTLRAMPHDQSHPNSGGQVAVYAIQERAVAENLASGPGGKGFQEGKAYTLEARHHVQAISAAIPRRLTPRECERLMGWPDDWTRYGITDDGREIELADGPRYRMCGNGVGAPVAEWIGHRILAMDTAARKEATIPSMTAGRNSHRGGAQ